MGKNLFLCLFLLAFTGVVIAQNKNSKPRVIVTSDGEVDDECSMVRFLLYANKFAPSNHPSRPLPFQDTFTNGSSPSFYYLGNKSR